MNAQPGSIILQPLSFDPKSACIAFHELTLLKIPRYCHCGVYVGQGQMITASGKVERQDAGATGNVAVPYAWKDLGAALVFLDAQIGKPYDWIGWALAGIEPLTRWFYRPALSYRAYTCSALVAAALYRDDPVRFASLNLRTVTPDDLAAALKGSS